MSHNGDTKPLLSKVDVQDDDADLSPVGESPSDLLTAVDPKHHLDEIIPKTHSRRTIVLCFDGTGDQFSEDVRTIFSKRNPQLIYHKIQRILISFSSSPC